MFNYEGVIMGYYSSDKCFIVGRAIKVGAWEEQVANCILIKTIKGLTTTAEEIPSPLISVSWRLSPE